MTFLVQLSLAVVIFFITNWLGRHARPFGYLQMSVIAREDGVPAFNFVFRVLVPLALMVVAAAALQATGLPAVANTIGRLGVYYVLLRIVFNVVAERASLLNWGQQLVQAAAIVAGAYGIQRIARADPYALLPNLGDIGNELWLVMGLFAYNMINAMRFSRAGTIRRKERYLKRRYQEYRSAYGEIIDSLPSKQLRALAYAILIFEAFNRPWVYRFIENRVLFPLGRAHTLGIMQVRTDVRLSDYESVRIGTEKILADYNHALIEQSDASEVQAAGYERWLEYQVIRRTAAAYNRDDDYVAEVLEIYNELLEKHLADQDPQAEPALGHQPRGITKR